MPSEESSLLDDLHILDELGIPSSAPRKSERDGNHLEFPPSEVEFSAENPPVYQSSDVLTEFLNPSALDEYSHGHQSYPETAASLPPPTLVVEDYQELEDTVPSIVVNEQHGIADLPNLDVPYLAGDAPTQPLPALQQMPALESSESKTNLDFLFAERPTNMQLADDFSGNSPAGSLDPFSPITSAAGSPVPFPQIDNSGETVSPLLSPYLNSEPAFAHIRNRAVSDSSLAFPFIYDAPAEYTLSRYQRQGYHTDEESEPTAVPLYRGDYEEFRQSPNSYGEEPNTQRTGRSVEPSYLQAPLSARTSRSPSQNRIHKNKLAAPRNRPRAISNPVENTATGDNDSGLMFCCDQCDKKFTRAYNLRSHMRTHTDERPFLCTVCGKAFARLHDRKRHEDLHSGEKRYACSGKLSDDASRWGCGRRFARADALGRHFRTEAGKGCIRPLAEDLSKHPDINDHPEGIALHHNTNTSHGLELTLVGDDKSHPSQRTVIMTALSEYMWNE